VPKAISLLVVSAIAYRTTLPAAAVEHPARSKVRKPVTAALSVMVPVPELVTVIRARLLRLIAAMVYHTTYSLRYPLI
jgi:hypothetical protein